MDCITSIALSDDNKYLATGSKDSVIKIWDINKRSEVATIHGHSRAVSTVVFINNNTIISGGLDSKIMISDIKKKQPAFLGHFGKIEAVSITHDCQYIISGGSDTTIRIWILHAKEHAFMLEGHKDTIKYIEITYDDRFIVSQSYNDIRIWNFKKKSQEYTFQLNDTMIQCARLTYDDKDIIAYSVRYSAIVIWNIDIGKAISPIIYTKIDSIKSLFVTRNKKYAIISDNSWNIAKVFKLPLN